MSAEDRALGSLLGLAVGDAVGTTVEFKPRGSFAPLTDMVGAAECLDACRLLASILARALAGVDKADALLGDAASFTGTPAITALARGDWREKSEHHIAGTGYVVKSLEAALWSVWTTETFEAAILRAANLGDDADTTAAVAGQIAGALYGSAGIPRRWLERLAMRDEMVTIAKRL